MLLITQRESHFHSDSINYNCYTDLKGKLYYCVGLLQILVPADSSEVDKLLDPSYNISKAYLLWLSGGYEHWKNTK